MPHPAGPGGWYISVCSGGLAGRIFYPPVWIPGKAAPRPRVDPAVLARQAYNQLALPSPAIRVSPTGEQLVNLPSWLWLDPSSWGDRSASAAVPGVSVTARARPGTVSWSMGDGTTVSCQGSGTPYRAGDNPAAASPDCGYTYRRSSAAQPGQAFAVTVTVQWTVSWSGAGQDGTFPGLTTTASATMRVAESQALNGD
jgi:hypothetical protein